MVALWRSMGPNGAGSNILEAVVNLSLAGLLQVQRMTQPEALGLESRRPDIPEPRHEVEAWSEKNEPDRPRSTAKRRRNQLGRIGRVLRLIRDGSSVIEGAEARRRSLTVPR
jgi:hypothetical protein